MLQLTSHLEQGDVVSNKKIWFITGAGRGMGADFAKAALAAGHSVVASGRDPDRVSKALGQSDDLFRAENRRVEGAEPGAVDVARIRLAQDRRMTPLTGTVALVTGTSSGIGHATALALAARGASVALVARRQDRLEALEAQIQEAGGNALAVPADITNRAQAEAAVRAVVERFGRLDMVTRPRHASISELRSCPPTKPRNSHLRQAKVARRCLVR